MLGETALIPFKARAFLDLSARKEAGERVDSKDVKKHRNDVFRVLQLLQTGTVHPLPDAIRADMQAFLAVVAADDAFEPNAFGVKMSAADALARLTAAYGL